MATKQTKPIYHDGKQRFRSFAAATEHAVNRSLQTGRDQVIIENDPDHKTLFITIVAKVSYKP